FVTIPSKHDVATQHAIVDRPQGLSDTATRRVLTAFGIGLAIYLVAFYRSQLHSATTPATDVLRRGHVLVSLFLGDEMVANWVEGCSWSSIAERAAIVATAAAMLAAATAAGWIALQVLRANRALSQLESFALSAGVGLQLSSLATLALGLAGLMR